MRERGRATGRRGGDDEEGLRGLDARTERRSLRARAALNARISSSRAARGHAADDEYGLC
eukprot:3939563-Rhodomonas_salina.2